MSYFIYHSLKKLDEFELDLPLHKKDYGIPNLVEDFNFINLYWIFKLIERG